MGGLGFRTHADSGVKAAKDQNTPKFFLDHAYQRRVKAVKTSIARHIIVYVKAVNDQNMP